VHLTAAPTPGLAVPPNLLALTDEAVARTARGAVTRDLRKRPSPLSGKTRMAATAKLL